MNEWPHPIRVSRIALMVLMLIAPLFGAGSSLILIICAASLTAYDGLRRATIYGISVALVGVELIYGMNIGVLSIAYIIAACALLLASRFVSVPSWTAVRGWRVSDAVRTLVTAYGLAAVIMASAVVVGDGMYGYNDVALRLDLVFSGDAARVLVGTTLLVALLRRIDEPFRRDILFGV